MEPYLDFEKPVAELEGKIRELRQLSDQDGVVIDDEIRKIEDKVDRLLRQTYAKLDPWQKTMVARHPARPHFQHYIDGLIEAFTPLAGDRAFGEDAAVIGGLGRFEGRTVMVIGQEKGSDTELRVKHNFGMARPEGYRKAVRLMELADRFRVPVVTFVDTPGAYPGIGAEERGQAEAIAHSTEACLRLKVPLVSVIVGEGGSGGALALAAANAVLMLEHAIYSVISPEGCASILWHSAERAAEAARALKLTAQDLKKLEVIDRIVEEPPGGAHRRRDEMVRKVGEALAEALAPLLALDGGVLRARRREKFLAMGQTGLA